MAVHVLTLLAMGREEESVCSEYIASSVNTNPVVIRRLLGLLRSAGLVEVQMGAHGGARLALPAREIDLARVYRVFEEHPFAPHPAPPNAGCPAGKQVPGVLGPIFARAEAALERDLKRTSIADVARSVKTETTRTGSLKRGRASGQS